MEETALTWLVGESSFLGIHFQNWMPLAVLFVVFALIQARRSRKNR
jgi:hypothetical protein